MVRTRKSIDGDIACLDACPLSKYPEYSAATLRDNLLRLNDVDMADMTVVLDAE